MKTARNRPPARRAFVPALEPIEGRLLMSVVAPADDRQNIANTTAYPYNAIVSIDMEYPNGEEFVGSGAMIDATHVLTVAHNIYAHANGGWARSVQVSPARNGEATLPYGSFAVTRETLLAVYTKRAAFADDLAVLTLARPINNPGDVVPVTPLNDAKNRDPAWTAGYPGDKPAYTMWQSTGHALGSHDRLSVFDLASTPGQSGSPIFEGAPTQPPRVISLVAGGEEGVIRDTKGPQITDGVAQDIKLWSTIDVTPASSRFFHPVRGQVHTYTFRGYVGAGETHTLAT